MPPVQTENKRIAKNTVFLYFRMLLVMGVTLYTSRVVLSVLGVEDYGIYNIVGGVVILFSFLKGSITTAIQRYLNDALGKKDTILERKIFSSSFIILGIISLIILLLLETIGLWFLNSKLNLPEGRIGITNIIYQISIATFIINIFRVPYDSLIMAHERMQFYAYVSIIEALLKLLIVFLLLLISSEKLILYSWLILGVTVVINVIYILYSRRNFKFPIFQGWNLNIIKELSSFSGWNVFGGIADIGYQQGTNIILNIFWGVAFNATMGIANQVKMALFSFVRNIIIAANPQIFQSYSAQDYHRFQSLVSRISKFAFFMFLLIAIPIIVNMELILEIWLTDIPPMGALFCILTVIFCIIDSLIGPLWTAAQAEGNIKWYQILSSSILLLNLPITYLCYKLGGPPYMLLIVQIIIVLISLCYRIWYLSQKNIIDFKYYVKEVINPVTTVIILATGLCIMTGYLYPHIRWERLFINTPIYLIIVFLSIWIAGLNKQEKHFIKDTISKMVHKLHN